MQLSSNAAFIRIYVNEKPQLGSLGYTFFFSYHFRSKRKIVGIRYNRLVEAVLTCVHNQCFEQKL